MNPKPETPAQELRRLRKLEKEVRDAVADVKARLQYITDPDVDRVIGPLAAALGYGAVMDSASRLWERSLLAKRIPGGAHSCFPHYSVFEQWLRPKTVKS